MTLTDGTAGKFFFNVLEIDVETGLDGIEMLIEFSAHPFDLGVGFSLDRSKLLGFLTLEDDRIRKSLSAEIGSAGVVGVVDPQAGGLILAVEGNELDIEKREEVAAATLFTPFFISIKRIEIVYADNTYSFGSRHVQCLSHSCECTERIGSVHVGVYVYYLSHFLLMVLDTLLCAEDLLSGCHVRCGDVVLQREHLLVDCIEEPARLREERLFEFVARGDPVA